MKFTTRITNLGIELSLGTEDRKPLEPAPDADQAHPRKVYVYAHQSDGKNFYVGVGQGRRAWSTDRHFLWQRYVEKHLGGKYQVCILQDNLSMEEAEVVEADWIAQCAGDLVNWMNAGRETDMEALNRYHKLRDANRALIQHATTIEKNNLAEAADTFVRAIEAIKEYASISYEKGLVGKLLDEEVEEEGRSGEIEALDRLTMCLIKLGRSAEAAQHATNYFALYRRDQKLGAAAPITKRIEKALGRTR